MLLAEAYRQACEGKTDISEHCPTLRSLSSQCGHVTEFGVRYGTSTVALLSGLIDRPRPFTMVSYDIVDLASDRISKLSPDVWTFRKASTLEVTIDLTDLLFIDTKHTGYHLLKELCRHADNVRKWIVLHDTETFGRRGERGRIGLMAAVAVFVGRCPDWRLTRHWANNNGLTLLERIPEH
jgi:hypothetical protein